LYAKEYSKLFEKVLAFEPEPTNFWCLTQNVPERNVAKIQAALGGSRSWCGLDNPGGEVNCGGWRTIQNRATEYGHITPVMRIDDFVGVIGLIHLDVEGFELDVLKGAAKTLYYCSPIVCLETIGNGDDEGCRQYLRQFGYEIAEILEHDTIYRK